VFSQVHNSRPMHHTPRQLADAAGGEDWDIVQNSFLEPGPDMDAAAIAQMLGRSFISVFIRRQGSPTPAWWTPEDAIVDDTDWVCGEDLAPRPAQMLH